ncbi:MAG: hypothetical protein OEY10_00220 [Nitrosopumilus sp.]|nr:hypothetical protein [Nitrosopumilus sp.]
MYTHDPNIGKVNANGDRYACCLHSYKYAHGTIRKIGYDTSSNTYYYELELHNGGTDSGYTYYECELFATSDYLIQGIKKYMTTHNSVIKDKYEEMLNNIRKSIAERE